MFQTFFGIEVDFDFIFFSFKSTRMKEPIYSPFSASSAMMFSAMGAAYGTAKSGRYCSHVSDATRIDHEVHYSRCHLWCCRYSSHCPHIFVLTCHINKEKPKFF